MYQIAIFVGSDYSEMNKGDAATNAQQKVNAWLAKHPGIVITHMTSAVNDEQDILITILYQESSAAHAQPPIASSGVWTGA